MATYGYGRTSSRERTGEDLRLDLERAGYALTRWYADIGVGSTVPALRRPQFRLLLSQVRKHDILVVACIDCLGSDADDIGSMIRMLAASGIRVVVQQLGGLEVSGPAGKLVLATLAALAHMARDELAGHARPGPIESQVEGRRRGRPTSTTQKQRASIIKRHQAGESISALARAEELSRASIMRIVRPAGLQ